MLIKALTYNPVSMKRINTNHGLSVKRLQLMSWIIALPLFFLHFPAASLRAQAGQGAQSIFDYLNGEGDVIQLTLQTDMGELINNRMREEYQPAILSFISSGGKETQMEVDVIPRGNYRRRICDFPPIMLNFSKTILAERGLNREYDKIKLVTHCKKEGEAQGYLLKEYLAYRIYNLLNTESYRVHLARINYVDSKGNYNDIEQYGILIEDTDELAHRIGGSECECWNYSQDSVSLADENTMSVFQYMIGNEDWSIPMLRNVKLIRPSEGGRAIPVPYDFDFSGFVNAPYAVPPYQLGLTEVTQRLFLGFPVEEEVLSETLKSFEHQRGNILLMVENFKEFGRSERKETVKYLEGFFQKKSQRQLSAEIAGKRMESANN